MRIRPAVTILLLVGVLAGLAVGTASPAAAKGKPCWERVIDDWLDNGNIDGTYKPACYQRALKHVPEDLRDYSNITDAISAALQNALRGDNPSGGGQSGGGQSNGGDDKGDSTPRHLQNVPDRSYYRRAIDNLGTTSADSLPIPLLVLAGLGTALLLTAAGLAARKRLKARPRPPQAP
ncbi:MAG: hypothetical protein ACJ743_07600 [Gaiellaceae bacterium]